MRVFVTGATGFIGSAVVRELVGAGHAVVGLARSDGSARALASMGAQVRRGDIQDLESLRAGAAEADGVVHTAFMHGLGQMSLGRRLRVFLGGRPGGIVGRYMGTAVRADRQAIEVMGAALERRGGALVAAFATMGMQAGRLATEDDGFDAGAVGAPRARTELVMQALARRGVRSVVVRLPPVVHGDGDRAGFASRLIAVARRKKVSAYVGDGANRWPAVHRADAATLFRLALEKGEAGSVYHGVGEEGVAFRSLAEVIGRRLGVPVTGLAGDAAVRHFSWMGMFAGADNPTSSALTQERLGWRPAGVGMIEDLGVGGYF